VKVIIQIHPGDDISDDGIREFWALVGVLEENITIKRLRTPTSKRRIKRKTPFGTCRLRPIKNGAILYSYYEGQRAAIIEMV
jgi:hypothetical protein